MDARLQGILRICSLVYYGTIIYLGILHMLLFMIYIYIFDAFDIPPFFHAINGGAVYIFRFWIHEFLRLEFLKILITAEDKSTPFQYLSFYWRLSRCGLAFTLSSRVSSYSVFPDVYCTILIDWPMGQRRKWPSLVTLHLLHITVQIKGRRQLCVGLHAVGNLIS